MLRRTVILIMVIVLGAFIFAGCSTSTSTKAGDAYLGKWSGQMPADVRGGLIKFEISRNGESYLIKHYTIRENKTSEPTIESASLTKDGILQITGGNTLTHVKAEDTLLFSWYNIILKRDK